MKIYISGPITDSLNYKEKFNIAYDHLKAMFGTDIAIINPTTLPAPTHLVWKEFMKIDLMQLLTCNTIYMLKGWSRSKGATLEHHVAYSLDLNILYECPDEYLDDSTDKISHGECV